MIEITWLIWESFPQAATNGRLQTMVRLKISKMTLQIDDTSS
jgi:hypothetical protein